MGALAAAYAIEKYGTQQHRYTAEEFVTRFDAAFPDHAGAVSPEMLGGPAPVPANA